MNKLEDTVISDIFNKEFDKNESYEIKKVPVNNESEDTIVSDIFNQESDNYKLHEKKRNIVNLFSIFF